jgi:hypothetical protein
MLSFFLAYAVQITHANEGIILLKLDAISEDKYPKGRRGFRR